MRKFQSLREHMQTALSKRLGDGSDLYLHIPTGAVQATQGNGFAYGYSYVLVLSVLDWAHPMDEIVVPLLQWVQRWQSDLIANSSAPDGITFEAEDLEGGKMDIMISLKVTETVHLSPRPDGGLDVTRPEDPLPFALIPTTPLHRVYLDGDLIAACDQHTVSESDG